MKKKLNEGLVMACMLSFIFFGQSVAAAESSTNTPTDSALEIQREPGGAIASEQMDVVADINFRDPLLLKQENNNLDLYFRLENNYSKSEAGIRYGVQLIKDETLYDERVYSADVLSIEGNSSTQKVFSYQAPSYLSGDFELWLVAKNESGLPLAVLKLEKPIALSGSGEYLEINTDACGLKIEGDGNGKVYSLPQGVSLKPEEGLIFSCEVTSHFKESVSVYPLLSTFKHSLYGSSADKDQRGAELALQPGEKKFIDLTINKPASPQTYEARVTFLKSNALAVVARPVILRYVVSGESATIQKLDLDKISYQKGEMINVTLLWSGLVDGSNDSHIGNAAGKKVTADLVIANQANQLCMQIQGQALDQNSNIAKFELKSNIDCSSPNVKITLKNEQGKVLAERDLHFQKDKISEGETQKSSPNNIKKAVLLIVSIILLFLVIAIVVKTLFSYKKNKTENLLLLLLLFGALFGWRLQSVEALTLSRPFNSWGAFSYSVNLNKGTYIPGEAISVTYDGSAALTGCVNYSGGNTTLLAATNTSGSWSDFGWKGNSAFTAENGCTVSNFGSWSAGNAPSSSGVISLKACITGEGSGGVAANCSGTTSGGGNFDLATGDIYYTVAPPSNPTCEIHFSASSYNVNSWGPLTWSTNDSTHGMLFCSGLSPSIDGPNVAASYTNFGIYLNQTGTVRCTFIPYNGSTAGAACYASAVVSAVIPTPTCTVSFSDTDIQAPDTVYLTWNSSNADRTIGACSGIGSAIPAADYGLSYSNFPFPFVATDSGTETCTFTPYIGATAGTPCSASVLVRPRGVCGIVNGTSPCTQPTANLCDSSSTASTVTGSGPWFWTCAGANGGGSVSCSATKSCQPASCHASFSPSNITTTSATPASSVLEWDSIGDSMTVSCTGPMPISPAMNVANPASGSGSIPFTVDQTGTEVCTFTPYNGATPGATCEATVSVRADAVCGSSNGGISCLAPTSNLCTLGTLQGAPTVYSGTWWGWTCLGLNGGANKTCSTTIDCASPSCVANFSPTSLTAPGTSRLTWIPSNADKMLGTCSGIGATIPEGDYGLSNITGYPFDFTASQTGTETCTFTPYMGATRGTPCSASVLVNDDCECSTVFSGGTPCPSGTSCDGCHCVPTTSYTCMPTTQPTGTMKCPGTRESGFISPQSWTNRGTLAACTGVLGMCEYYIPSGTFGCNPVTPPVGTLKCPGTREAGFSSAQPWTPKGTLAACTGVSGICEYYTPAGTFGCNPVTPPAGTTKCPGTQETGFSSLQPWTNKATFGACTGASGICEYYSCSMTPQCYYPTTCTPGVCGVQNEECLPVAPPGCGVPPCLATSCTGTIYCPCNSGGWQEISH
ncbi:MAG: hypothetical protein WAV73_02020 [Candidatus Moraniibacteriota bacterium]